MSIRSKLGTFKTPVHTGQCATTDLWRPGLEWTRMIESYYKRGGPKRALIDQLLAAHDRVMPHILRCGQELVTELDDEQFSDNIFLMTSCGVHPSWERPSQSRTVRLHSLIAFPSSF